MHILIAGGSGNIGRKLQLALLEKGHTLTVLTRNKSLQDDSVQYLYWDGIEVPTTLQAVDVIINLCGASIAEASWTDERRKILRESRLQPTKALIHFMEKHNPDTKLFLNGSAVGFYGDRQFELLTEESKSGNGFLAELSEEWENAAQNSITRTVLLRTGIVLDKDSGAMPEALKTFSLGFGGYFGKGNQGFPWIHMDDEVGLICFAIENPEIKGALNLVAPETVSYKQFIETAAKIKSKFVAPAPEFVLNLALGSRAELILSSQYVYPEKAVKNGYKFRFPQLEQALEDLL